MSRPFIIRNSVAALLTVGAAATLSAYTVVDGVGVGSEASYTTSSDPTPPGLRTGVLPNGLRYYVQANKAPAKRAYLWLAVNAGSAQEDDDQLGYAHFLEHMAFNGTKNFPRQELIDFIESTGMSFGADLNAYTSFDETVYQLTIPTDDPSYLDRGLLVLEDWAGGGITLDSAEVVAERGVVLGEWRMRSLADTATERMRVRQMDLLFGGTRYRERMPIGTPESIESATVEPLRRFYRDWYRPDLMAVIAVGDFDPDFVEQEIKRRFGAIPAAKEPRERKAIEVARATEPLVDIWRDKVSPGVDVLWPAPMLPSEPRALVKHELVSELLLGHVQEQIQRIRKQDRVPFVNASIGHTRLARPLNLLAASLGTWPDSLETGLAALLTEIERVARDGIPEAVLKQRKAAILRQLEHEAASESALPSRVFAAEYSQHFLTGEGALLGAGERLALARQVLPEITPKVVAEAAKFWRERSGLKVLVRIPQLALGFRPPTQESILAILDSIQRGPLSRGPSVADAGSAGAKKGSGRTLLAKAPKPGKVVAERRYASSGVVEWILSNGARVLFKESQNDPDDLQIRAWSPGGRVNIPDSLFFTPGRMVAHVMNEAAGLGEKSRDELVQGLQTSGLRRLKVDIGYAAETIDVAGSPSELERLFETLHLQFVAPKLDSAALAAWANTAKYTPRSPESPLYQLDQRFMRGLPRYVPVQTGTAELARVEQMLAVHQDRFGNAGDFTFLIVGAAPEKEVKALVERYLASLPATEVRETPKFPKRAPYKGSESSRTKYMPFARAEVLRAHDGLFPTEPEVYLREKQRLDALTLVLQRRLRDKLREEIAGTYGVTVLGTTYPLVGEHFRTLIQFQADPELAIEMTRAMLDIIDTVKVQGAGEVELSRIARIQQRRLETALQSNGYWLQQLELYNRLGLPLDRIVSPYPDAVLTADDVKAAAKAYLPEDAFIQVVVEPTEDVMKALAEKKKGGEEKKEGAGEKKDGTK